MKDVKDRTDQESKDCKKQLDMTISEEPIEVDSVMLVLMSVNIPRIP